LEFRYERLTTLRVGDFVYPKLMAWEGALAVVPKECDGLVVSTEFPVFEIDSSRVLPEVLDVYFRDPSIWPQLSGRSTGTNVRRQRLNTADFLNYQFPLPPLRIQEQLQQVVGSLSPLRALQSETAAELDALLPSVLNQAFAGKL
jgi:type I restriction enzyme S subunit